MLLSTAEMKSLEGEAIAGGVSVETLMEEAGKGLADAVRQFHPRPGLALLYVGKGHNGGDALVAGRHLFAAGWRIALRLVVDRTELSPLTLRMLLALSGVKDSLAEDELPDVILDGLLGIGAQGPLREWMRTHTLAINSLRNRCAAMVVAIDLPSGLDPVTGIPDPDTVRADITVCMGYAKSALVTDAATAFVGRLAVVPLSRLALQRPVQQGDCELATARTLQGVLPRRSFDVHKGNQRRVGIVAGSIGFAGAAVLASTGAMRAGAGLTILFATDDVYPLLAIAAPPEVMVRPVQSYREVLDQQLDVLAVGPGLGTHHAEDIRSLIREFNGPAVVDADALNILAAFPDDLKTMAGPRILTPHPGEMARLFPEGTGLSRLRQAEEFVVRFPVTLLLKGARTVVCESGQISCYNSTGSPALAKGGSGDVLTGVCAALLAQGLSCRDTGRVGAWLCGRAAELALLNSASEESLTATEVLQQLGAAFHSLRTGSF